MHLQNWIRKEYIIGFICIFIIYIGLDYSILLFFMLLLVPDVSMVGYVMNTKIGVLLYNIVHHLSLPTILLTICIRFNIDPLIPISLIWIAHILMDRALGFGLKYTNNFKETHLQKIV
ncbi:DUF4260 domain-containing protein [Lysinibacillus sp. 54212]|uniref:DUF4260 domain-containing protein n=1 Tax=Lysinibacillus sp. 54212 TaxID=3119829 RepID=UPI002FCAF454